MNTFLVSRSYKIVLEAIYTYIDCFHSNIARRRRSTNRCFCIYAPLWFFIVYNIHFFPALTLKGAKASEVWDPEAKEAEDYQGGHKLIIKQALLGPEAVDGEVNVLQVEAKTWKTWKKPIQIPVAVLKAGSANSQVLLDLSFPDPPVTFSLAQGSGPVHIIGHHLIGSPIEEFEEMDEMEEEMLEDEESEEGAVSSFGRWVSHFLWLFQVRMY